MELKRTRQCKKCPWRVNVDPRDIPNGYDEVKHANLINTIADPHNPLSSINQVISRVMACHETHDAHCVGWLNNQIGVGNNIGLRFQMRNCSNIDKLSIVGEQRDCFKDTLPESVE
ncbi:MAG: hypothetical protein ACJAS1_001646 [Oleiphilaceae bacterium]|jgi:hypothetical protein